MTAGRAARAPGARAGRAARALSACGLAAALAAAPVRAQHAPGGAPIGIAIGAQAVPTWIRAEPVPRPLDGAAAEARILAPVLMVHAAALEGRLGFIGTLNFEGATLAGGELAPGAWGEGFVDRRHPHTYFHELVVTGDDLLGPADGGGRLSLSAGKGFAPFGSDDPMVRPALRYPVNHHLAQILERAVLIAAWRLGPAAAEVGLFNGDEPERPSQWPLIVRDGDWRFGDSWSARLTLWPARGLELAGSFARVHSPEHRPGQGVDQEKLHLSVRWEGAVAGRPLYGFAEWARTAEAHGFFEYESILAEGAWRPGRHRLLYRIERTERPEEERLSPFRSRRPHVENAILGVTRWTTHTVGYGYAVVGNPTWRAEPFVELSAGRIAAVGDGIFDVETQYGRSTFTSLAIGVRLGAGRPMDRMGRYGAALPPSHDHPEAGDP